MFATVGGKTEVTFVCVYRKGASVVALFEALWCSEGNVGCFKFLGGRVATGGIWEIISYLSTGSRRS